MLGERRLTHSCVLPGSDVCILQLETEPLYTGLFRLNDASRPRVEKFYASLPRMLWELRSKDLSGTTVWLIDEGHPEQCVQTG